MKLVISLVRKFDADPMLEIGATYELKDFRNQRDQGRLVKITAATIEGIKQDTSWGKMYIVRIGNTQIIKCANEFALI